MLKKKKKKLKQKKEYEEKIQNDITKGVNLIEAYVSYIIIKNLGSQYGGYEDLNESKKLIKLIEDYYKDLVDTSIDKLWDRAITKYRNSYSSDIETLASFYSSQGLNYYKLTRWNLQNQANQIGVSTSDTNKDF